MRSFLLLSIICALALIALVRPKVGVFAVVWFSLMRPDVWAWSTEQYPYASILEFATLIGSLKYVGQLGTLVRNRITRLVLLLQIPIALSVVFAIHPSLCYQQYRWYVGCVVTSMLIALHIRTVADLKLLLIIAALSIGYLGARFGLYGLLHGGVRFAEGYGASLSDNNTLALALAMGVPLGWYMKDLIPNKLVRLSLIVSVFLTIAAVIFTHSRGAALSLIAVFLIILLHSRRRLLMLVMLVILTGPSLYLVQDTYFNRMSTLKDSKKDESATSRVEAAEMAKRIWADYPLFGVGFGMKNQQMLWYEYIAVSAKANWGLVLHNTYLQMLVDSGMFALSIYLALLLGAILSMERSTRRLKRLGSSLYVCPLAIEAALVAFAVGSTFLSRITFDFTYYLLMMAAAWLAVEPEHLESLEEEAEREAGETPDPALQEALA